MKVSMMLGAGGLLLGFAAFAILPGCAVFGVRKTPEPDYEVVFEQDDIEVRRYAPMILAQTTVEGSDFDESSSVAFRRLFNYITGENTSSEEIAMTAPVLQEEKVGRSGEKIAMTAPVLQEESAEGGNSWDVSFVLPASFTLQSAPQPTNPQVKIVEREARHVATLRFSGRRDEARYTKRADELKRWLASKGYEQLSAPRYAGYDPPYTLPMMRRNEVLIDVEPPAQVVSDTSK